MGLELAELIMDVEDTFGIQIEESDERLTTVGGLCRLVQAKLDAKQPQAPVAGSENCGALTEEHERADPDKTWAILKGLVAECLGVPPEKVTPEARFVEDLGAG